MADVRTEKITVAADYSPDEQQTLEASTQKLNLGGFAGSAETIKATLGSGKLTVSVPAGTNAGEYELTVNMVGVKLKVTVTINKVNSSVVAAPTPLGGTYNGKAQALIEQGIADGGTMKYWVEGDASDYSSTIPFRTNVSTYTVWYMVVGTTTTTPRRSPLRSP